MEKQLNGFEIAVIGMSVRFPGADTKDEYWDNLINGRESIKHFTRDELLESGESEGNIDSQNYIPAKGYVKNCEYFDASLFHYSNREIELMDPQTRLFHECVREALEDAGYTSSKYDGLIGLYGGASNNLFWEIIAKTSEQAKMFGAFSTDQLANKDYMCQQVSHCLNLKGPSININTACSTSLVAVHLAVQALLNGECSIALAGGASISLPLKSGYLYEEGMILSKDGHCRPFDDSCSGTVPSNGAGVVALKLYEDALADGDHIYAVIKGTAVNNDGNEKSGFTAPSVEGQADVIRTALQVAEVDADTIQFVETHGTGTNLGDAIEIEALKQAYDSQSQEECCMGAVKSNIGHLDAAAGVAGLIKAILCLQHRKLPAMINYNSLNTKINLSDSRFNINQQTIDYGDIKVPLRAGVSAFGIGGTNAHVILEEEPKKNKVAYDGKAQLMLLSANSETRWNKMASNLSSYLKKNPYESLQDIAYTLQVGREDLKYRGFILASNNQELTDILDSINDSGNTRLARKIVKGLVKNQDRKIAFVFPGLESQYVNMGRELYETEPLFAKELDECFEILSRYSSISYKDILYPEENTQENANKLKRIECSQLILFMFEYSLGKYLMKIGIEPDYMIGYSFGEYACACLSGVFSFEDAVQLLIKRGELIKQTQKGGMLSVPFNETELRKVLPEKLDISIVNSMSCIVAGEVEEIEKFEQYLTSQRMLGMRLDTTYAIHSRLMLPIADEFINALSAMEYHSPAIPIVSGMKGDWLSKDDAKDPTYWLAQLTSTVHFADGIEKLLGDDPITCIEVGPDRRISNLIQYFLQGETEHATINLVKPAQVKMDDVTYLMNRLGQIWLQGHSIKWELLDGMKKKGRVSLPTYPYDRSYIWNDRFNQGISCSLTESNSSIIKKKQNIDDWFYALTWQQKRLVSSHPISKENCWLVLGNEDQLTEQLTEVLVGRKQKVINVLAGTMFKKISSEKYEININNKADYQMMLQMIHADGYVVDKVLHLWSIGKSDVVDYTLPFVLNSQKNSYYSVMKMVQCLCKNINQKVQVGIVSEKMFSVLENEELRPDNAMLYGLGLVIPQEMSNIDCVSIDVSCDIVRDDGKRIVEMILREFEENLPERLVVYRNSQRYIPTYQAVKLKVPQDENYVFKEGGVYLLTGGTGNIGMMIANYLASTYHAKIALVQRSFPMKEEWSKWLINHSESDTTSIKIEQLMELEKKGAEIKVYKADCTDYNKMQDVIDNIKNSWGAIDGVFHCAVQMGENFFYPITESDELTSNQIFSSKIGGLIVLSKLLKGDQLDFVLIMSSTASILGGYGFSAYSAANIFVDVYTKMICKTYHCNWKSVNWEAWKTERLGKSKYQSAIVDLTMTYEEATESLRRVLSEHELVQIIHSPGDIDQRFRQWVRLESDDVCHQEKKKKIIQSNVPYKEPTNDIEEKITQIWEDYMGVEQISTQDNFFDLGATSLMLIRIKALIEQKLDVELSITDFFEYPTIMLLAKRIEERDLNKTTLNNQDFEDQIVGKQNLMKQMLLRKSGDVYE